MSRELTAEEQASLLTQEEVDALPSGTRVVVKWCGGNGPHEYVILHEAGEEHAFAVMPDGSSLSKYDGRLHPVGIEPCHDRVFLAPLNLIERAKAEYLKPGNGDQLDERAFIAGFMAGWMRRNEALDQIEEIICSRVTKWDAAKKKKNPPDQATCGRLNEAQAILQLLRDTKEGKDVSWADPQAKEGA